MCIRDRVVIKLKGYASNPYITTAELAEGVKYVPYSFVVATNNMHDWNDVEFKIKSGKLPNGVTLSSVNGEIYGVPTEAGEFPIRIEANYSNSKFKPYYADFTLVEMCIRDSFCTDCRRATENRCQLFQYQLDFSK